MGERALILGPTGVEKSTAIANLRRYQLDKPKEKIIQFTEICFEDLILEANPRKKLYQYLDKNAWDQKLYWESGWNILKEKLNTFTNDEDILLSMHGVLVRETYGTRSPVILNKVISDFKPTVIINLIDDVYLQWYRTEMRADIEEEYIGTPTLEQLLQARRAEYFLGDYIASNMPSYPEHFVVACAHPVSVLDNILFQRGSLRTAYLSFPISKPRKLQKDGKSFGIEAVNHFLTKANKYASENQDIVFFCPLTIDEYPLIKESKISASIKLGEYRGEKNVRLLHFPVNKRWDVKEFYGHSQVLLKDNSDTSIPEIIEIPVEQVIKAIGMIDADVSIRDYQLVKQSACLNVFNPIFPNVKMEPKLCNGVNTEIAYCLYNIERPVRIFQDSQYDPDLGKVQDLYKAYSESMKSKYGSNMVRLFFEEESMDDNLDNLFKATCGL